MPPTDAQPPVTIYFVIRALIFFGAFGGVAATLNLVQIRDVMRSGMSAYGSFWRLIWCIVVGAFWGAGAALAASVILATDDKFEGLASPEAKVRLKAEMLIYASGLIAGFAGINLLKRLSSKFGEEDVKRLENEIKETKAEIAEDKEQTTELVTAIGWATLALSKPTKGDDPGFVAVADQAIAKLERVRPHFPTDRSVAIFLGRLFRWKGDVPSAIRILETTLEASQKARKGEPGTRDEAAMLFNLACYRNLMCRRKGPDAPDWRIKAVKALNEATKICPEFLDDAKTDDDLKDIV